MGTLSTHILDITTGLPACGLRVILRRHRPAEQLAAVVTNLKGRTDISLPSGASLTKGHYDLEFEVASYFRRQGWDLPDPPFLDIVLVRFGISDENSHYHVPLLVSPWSYTTYRGS
jgi:5-hydroxyisourate hydrolase